MQECVSIGGVQICTLDVYLMCCVSVRVNLYFCVRDRA